MKNLWKYLLCCCLINDDTISERYISLQEDTLVLNSQVRIQNVLVSFGIRLQCKLMEPIELETTL